MPSFAVIGASRGVGLELVRQLSASPANTVVVTVRNQKKSTYLNDLVQQSENSNVHVIEADVVDKHAMERAVTEATKITGGALDVLVYNAARMEAENRTKGFLDYETPESLEEEFIASFKVNVLGVVHTVNAFLPLLRKGTTKKIIILGSEGGDCSFVWRMRLGNSAVYGTTKAAENMVATKYAAELEARGSSSFPLVPAWSMSLLPGLATLGRLKSTRPMSTR